MNDYDNESVPHPLDVVELYEETMREARKNMAMTWIKYSEEYVPSCHVIGCTDTSGQCAAAGDCYCQ